MGKAIRNDELLLHYQPQFALNGLQLCGYEALVRWQHPEQGFLGPDRFIPVAEDTHLIVPLGWWVIESVCRQLADWQAQGQPLAVVAVNISPQQLLQADFIARLNETLDRYGLEHRWLELEITESTIMQDPDFVIQQLQRVRMCGYHLALDDFGTGYSSLNRIKYLPLNRIKIDKSFVRDIGHNPKDEAVVISAIALGSSLGVEVLAEGVETVEQSQFLERHGCNSVQGYLYGRPMPVEALVSDQMLAGTNP
nr:EAL domain-containing protein [Marinobacterium weihaiense]